MFEYRLKQEAVKEAFNSSLIVEELLLEHRLFVFRDNRRDRDKFLLEKITHKKRK